MWNEQNPPPVHNSYNRTSNIDDDWDTPSSTLPEKSSDAREQNGSTRIVGLLSWSSHHDGLLEEPPEEIEKPQSKFVPRVDNSDSPFKPRLRSKPHAIRPLRIYLETDNNGNKYYCHPYMHELNVFRVPPHQLMKAGTFPPSDTSIDDTITLVDDEKSLADMISHLRTVTEMAVDSEYHSFRSFFGFMCVLQISTRTKDYVIDAIALRSDLERLNEFFTDPKILKVMHAANSDVIWLQKDLNLYVVNLFDTSIAANALGKRQSGLGSLLKECCGITIEKRKDFQKYFDWRTRPLPREALEYSRDDTHYLLYLHDILRNQLSTEFLAEVYSRCTDLCKKTFRKPSSESGLKALLRKYSDGRKIHALKSLYGWRDTIAREMDESTGYVLPNKALLLLVDTLPEQIEDIDCCNSPYSAPPLVQKNRVYLHRLILEALEQPIDIYSPPVKMREKKPATTCSRSTQTDSEKDLKTSHSRSSQTDVLNRLRKQSQSTQTENEVKNGTVKECRDTSHGFLLMDIWRRYLLVLFRPLQLLFGKK